ncbi:small GTP-binding protein [Pelobacter propionicus DSM 2379]|uniref:GTPase HflX n=1 Tax=Pelobacter propionicus (strain DSM 2379 / NBRC 103807 / OttBd1) TaxID=338966 RepID=A1AT22_PELPD|nr:small GTP-binding protein [Pelobacter propionicus DSM 2379]
MPSARGRSILKSIFRSWQQRSHPIKEVFGNLTGLKTSQIQALERLYRRRIPQAEFCTQELAGRLVELSLDIRRQIGILVNRSGMVEYVIVGDERGLVIPELRDYPLGKRPLRGLRLIHTHLKNEQVSEDDLTDLSLLRLDLLAALLFSPEKRRISVQMAWISPTSSGPSTITGAITTFERVDLECARFLEELEADLSRSTRAKSSGVEALERAILVSVTVEGTRQEAEDSIMELRELARTAQIEVLDEFIQRPRSINPRFVMGEGKMRDVVIRALQHGATMLIFDQELTPAQIRSISAMTELKAIDRSQLILDIFARRAQTLDGKVQVELAQLKYLLPRLTGRGVQMSRLMGGIGGRGPGETKLETDRRRIRDRIASLERELKELSRGRDQRRRKRVKASVPIVSIVGYTNAGKSTLLNTLTKSRVFTEDLLFATLDTSTRRLRFPLEREVIITDTVGFIRSLPASLLGAFKATLEELRDADLLLHVVDASNPRFETHIQQVNRILDELELGDKPRLLIFNKSDLLAKLKKSDTIAFLRVRQFARTCGGIMIAATDRTSMSPLLEELQRRFWPDESSLID